MGAPVLPSTPDGGVKQRHAGRMVRMSLALRASRGSAQSNGGVGESPSDARPRLTRTHNSTFTRRSASRHLEAAIEATEARDKQVQEGRSGHTSAGILERTRTQVSARALADLRSCLACCRRNRGLLRSCSARVWLQCLVTRRSRMRTEHRTYRGATEHRHLLHRDGACCGAIRLFDSLLHSRSVLPQKAIGRGWSTSHPDDRELHDLHRQVATICAHRNQLCSRRRSHRSLHPTLGLSSKAVCICGDVNPWLWRSARRVHDAHHEEACVVEPGQG